MAIKWTEQDVIDRISKALQKVMQPKLQGNGQDTLSRLRQSVDAWKRKGIT